MIIGLTGKNAAGKGETANYLKSKGFFYHSLSDALRDEATKRGLEHTRDNLIRLGNELRGNFGPNYLAAQVNKKIADEQKAGKNKFVVDSIRSPFEAKELMKMEGFVLLGIEAPIETRFDRMVKRNRVGDAKTIEELKQHEERENLKNDSNQQLDNTLGLANKYIENDGTIPDLHKKIDLLVSELK